MSNEKISSLELISVISEQTGVTKKNATAFMRQFSETIETALLNDGIVKIKGFGTFKIIWNESRSSVNVQTGERYEIAGHNKITFTPDDELRDSVNVPYAHLEPVNLEGGGTEKTDEEPEEDPHMKRFSEQATEIMSMIADMQAFKAHKKNASTSSETAVEPEKIPATNPPADTVADAIQELLESINQNTATAEQEDASSFIPESTVSTQEPVTTIATTTQQVTEIHAATTTPSSNMFNKSSFEEKDTHTEEELVHRMAEQTETRSLKWLYITLSIIILLGGLGTAAYFLLPSLFDKQTTENAPAPQQTKPLQTIPAPPAIHTDTSTAVKPEKKAEPAASKEPEPTKDVFSSPRVYKEFMATEIAQEGTWLTMLSLKYYGHKLFWVYIYEANKDKLHNPEILPPGTKIRIPKLDPRLIDKYDGRCFRQASALQTLYTTKQP